MEHSPEHEIPACGDQKRKFEDPTLSDKNIAEDEDGIVPPKCARQSILTLVPCVRDGAEACGDSLSSEEISIIEVPPKQDEEDCSKVERSQLLHETAESQRFRALISRCEHLKDFRLQEGPCAVGFYTPCFACSPTGAGLCDDGDCRFYNRMLRSTADPTVCRRLTLGDVSKINAKLTRIGNEDEVECLMRTYGDASKVENGHNAQIAAYILQCIAPEFRKIVEREEEAARFLLAEADSYFSHSFRVKQICDACHFSILNAHFCCTTCGLEICPLCFDELCRVGRGLGQWLKKVPCLDGSLHKSSDFHFGSFLKSLGTFKTALSMIQTQFERYEIKEGGGVCNGNHGRRLFQTEKCYCPQRSHEAEVDIEPICVIKDQLEEGAYARFKAHIALHHPVIVEGVSRHPEYCFSLWNQEAFVKIIASYKKLKILDSLTFRPATVDGKPCKLDYFWKKFSSKHVDTEPYFKIKDFPETVRFRDVAPKQYENLFKVLPFLEYTHVNSQESGRGKLNLLNVLNDDPEPPDPGPKVYICLGLCDAPHLASTPLHLDVSNAVNFLPLVQAPHEMTVGELSSALEKRLTLEGVDEAEKERALRNPAKAGALWKIFHPDFNEKIRKAIAEWNVMKGRRWDGDVIHNQDVVVTPDMMKFFKSKGISCNTFVQNEGEVVFVPSGAAHQVQNLNSCIKVAEDFVAVEGVEHDVKISDELRLLKKKDDLVQIETLIYRACCSAAVSLSHCLPALATSALNP